VEQLLADGRALADDQRRERRVVAVTLEHRAAMRVHASAVSGTLLEGFQSTELPHTQASAEFQHQTATGKLKALITPTTPSGCHCSYIRWRGRSECIVRP